MPSIPHPIPYQGSKRRLAPLILQYFPERIDTLYEPFAGSAALTLAAADAGLATRFYLADSLAPLAEIWALILSHPDRLADDYERLWRGQQTSPRTFYDDTRDAYNESGGAARLLYLLARCVKNAVRFNRAGMFNQSPDNRRFGRRPARMREQIDRAHLLLRGRTVAVTGDYTDAIQAATPRDLVYIDPPYEGTSSGAGRRYFQSFERPRFISDLEGLNERRVPYLISLDGRTGAKTYGAELPPHLGLTWVELHAGRSSQATLTGRAAETYESLYLSPGLATEGMPLRRSVHQGRPVAASSPIG